MSRLQHQKTARLAGPFDRSLVRLRRDRSASCFHDHNFLFREVGIRLSERLQGIRRDFPVRLELGARDGSLGDLFGGGDGSTHFLMQSELSHELLVRGTGGGVRLVADEEMLPFPPCSVDAVFSVLALHWVNDLPGSLVQIRSILRPDGVFMAALFGGETLHELRSCLAEAEEEVTGGISPRVSPFANLLDVAGLLMRAGFTLPAADHDIITVTYPDMWRLLADIRGMGEANAVYDRLRTPTRRAVFLRAGQLYGNRHRTADGRIYATFHILYLTGWAAHDGQQEPQRRGSAAHRLSDVLEGG